MPEDIRHTLLVKATMKINDRLSMNLRGVFQRGQHDQISVEAHCPPPTARQHAPRERAGDNPFSRVPPL